MKTFTRTIQPNSYPISLTEIRDYLRLDHNIDLSETQFLIESAVSIAEEYTRRAFTTVTYSCLSDFMGNCFELRYGPIQSIESISATLNDGSVTQISPDEYYLTRATLNGQVVFKDFKCPDDVREFEGWEVVYKCGYKVLPGALCQALKLICAHNFEFREDKNTLPPEASRILDAYKIVTL